LGGFDDVGSTGGTLTFDREPADETFAMELVVAFGDDGVAGVDHDLDTPQHHHDSQLTSHIQMAHSALGVPGRTTGAPCR